MKAAIDGLVEAGVIADDGPGCVAAVTVEQVKCRRDHERTVIEVAAAGGME